MRPNRKYLVAVAFLAVVCGVTGTITCADATYIPGWFGTWDGTKHDEAHSVVQTSDGGYALAGYTCFYGAGGSDFWLVKTDPAGNMQWSQTYGGAKDEEAYCVIEIVSKKQKTPDAGYVLAGGTGSFGAGGYDFYLVKTDPAGNMQWSQTYGGAGYDEAHSVVQTSDGGYALAGSTGSFGVSGSDFWLVKTDSAGKMQWNKTYGGEKYDEGHSGVQTSDGGYALAGGTSSFGAGGYDFWLVKTDSAGNMQWNKPYGGGPKG